MSSTALPPGNCATHGYHGRIACPRCSTSALPPALLVHPSSPADLPVAAPAREIGPYRCNVIEATGVYVSTIFRESSAMEYASPYFETMALWLTDRKPEGARAILWQSAGRFEREADRQHDLAVRWFSREGVRFLA